MKDERLGLVDIINVYEQTKRLSLIGINDSSKPLHPSHSLFRLNNSSLEKVSKIGNISIDDDSSDDNDEDIDQEQHLVSNSFIQGSTAILCSQHLTSIVHDHEESSVLENESITDYLDYLHHKTMLIQNNNSNNNTGGGVINGNNSSGTNSANNNNPDTSLSDNNCLKLNDISSSVIENDIREYISSNLYKITYLLHHSTQMTESEMLEMIQLIESYLFYSNNNNNNNTSTTSPSNNSNNGNTTINSNNIHNNTHNNCNNSTIDFKKDLIDSKTKCSLLHTASKFDFLTVMQYLLDKQPDLLESKDRSDATPIFYACSSAHSKSVTMLAINGAILNTHDKYEASPLSVSLNSINKSKGFTVARTLLGFHVDIEYKVYCGNTILHLACREGDLEKVQFIVEDLKHNIFRKNTKQESCLFRAVKHEKITKYLIDFCENTIGREKLLKLLFMKNDKGQTVVHHCCSKGYMESLVHIVKCLARDSDKLELLFNEKDSVYGLTPLHVTVLAEQEEIFELLIRSKEIQLDVINKVGDTPLHIAVRNEKLAMIKELYHLYPSKSLQIKNNQKKTIDKLAKERDIDLKKLEKELEQDNAGIQKEGFWSSIFGNKKKKTKFSPSNSSSELQSRMSNMSRRNSLLVSVSWDPTKYAVGCDQIDSQHAQLIEWLKNLSEASLTSQSHWVVGYTIGCLIEYTEFHFSDEEQLLSKYKKGIGEEYVKKHHEEHLTFTTKMKNMQKDYLKSHATSLDIELLNYLINWLVKHINYTDRKLADYINTHKPDDEE